MSELGHGRVLPEQLPEVWLYLLIGYESCRHGWEETLRAALAGGAQMIQLREKNLADRELLERARRVRELTQEAGTLFIMNDRADIAVLADADGVHVGQEELPAQEVRKIIGPERLIGVSAHTIEQARQAVRDGADYIGVGPVFPSRTKEFAEYPGLELVRQVTAEVRLPAFAIGGIDAGNLPQVLAAGARRVAVSAAVCQSDDPAEAARSLRRLLDAAR